MGVVNFRMVPNRRIPIDDIIETLKDDLVSHGFLVQCLGMREATPPAEEEIKDVLTELLASGEVEIGETKSLPDYVEFIAWNGSIEDRVNRGIEAVAAADGHDKEFAYWLCLRQNVDRFE